MDVRQFTISKPTVRDNGFVPKHFVQSLKYQNETITFQSNLFYSNGPKIGMNKNYQLLTNLNPDVRDMLTQVENFVIANLELPPPIAEKWQEHVDASGDTLPFKRLYSGNNLYIKMAHDVQLFNMDSFDNGQYQPFTGTTPPLGPGMYIVLIEAPAVYLGTHNSNPKVASLQLRIKQIVYRASVIGQCRIVPHLDTLRPPAQLDDGLDHLFAEINPGEQTNTTTAVKANTSDGKTSRKRSTSTVVTNGNNSRKSKKNGDGLQNIIDTVVSQSS